MEKDTRPGWIPVSFGRGGPYSLGICKWHGETNTHFCTHNVAHSRLRSRTSEAQALRVISMHWPGCDSLDKINWIRSHTPVCMNNLDITLFPAMKTPAIHDAGTKTKYRWEEPKKHPQTRAMRRRCTPHMKEFDRNEGAALFQKYGYPWSFEAFLKSRNYRIMRINTKVTKRRTGHVASELFGDSQAE